MPFVTVPVNTVQRWLGVITAIVTLAVLALLGQVLNQGVRVEADLQKLFPKDQLHPLAARATEQLYREFGNKALLAVQAPQRDEARQAAEVLARAIAHNPLLHIEQAADHSPQLIAQQALIARHHFQLLTPQQREHLRTDPTPLLGQAQAALFGFNGNGLSPLDDPLNLVPGYLHQLQPALNGELLNDRLLVADEQGQLILFALSVQGEAFSLSVQEQVDTWLTQVRQQLQDNPHTANSQILVSGAIFHAAQAAQQAQREVRVIGIGSLVGLLLLFMLAFRRLQPLFLSVLSVAYGCGCAFVVTHWLFAEIHLMTLVFGASLIGVAVDYSLHYLCKYHATLASGGDRDKPVLDGLLASLVLSLITSVLAYSCLFQASLPGLQQIACFSIIGLACSWLFVMGLYPLLLRQRAQVDSSLPAPVPLVDRCAFSIWQFWQATSRQARIWLAVVLLGVFSLGAFSFSISNEVRTFYTPSPELMASERRLQQVLQGVSPNQYFLLSAASPEQLLQLEEQFRYGHLDPLVARGAVHGYTATSVAVPSQRQQALDYQLQRDRVYSNQGLASEFMQSAGFGAEAIADTREKFHLAAGNDLLPDTWLLPDAWLQVARPDQRLLWLGEREQSWVSIIGLRGVADVDALAGLASRAATGQNTILWVDRVADMSVLLQHLLQVSALLLLLAYGVIIVLLWCAYRQWRALVQVVVPMLTTLTTLSVLAILGVDITLFHVFGCYLILGLGMDYSIFSYVGGMHDRVSQRAIWLSVVTSLLSFGLLSLSSTPMVQAFGMTLLLGCLFNWLYAPLVATLKPPMQRLHRHKGKQDDE